MSTVKRVIAVASCKGGVGKTTLSVNLALTLRRLGHRVGVFDADVYGPNVPIMLGVRRKADRLPYRMVGKDGTVGAFIPLYSKDRNAYAEPLTTYGLEVMSLGLIFGEHTSIGDAEAIGAQLVTRLYNDTAWGELDYVIVDLPPGTGDVVQALLSAVKPDGVVVVTTPQEMALLDTGRSVDQLRSERLKILGRIENMAALSCPHCGKPIEIHTAAYAGWEQIAGLELLGSLPLDPAYARPIDGYHPLTQVDLSSPGAQAFVNIAKAVISRV